MTFTELQQLPIGAFVWTLEFTNHGQIIEHAKNWTRVEFCDGELDADGYQIESFTEVFFNDVTAGDLATSAATAVDAWFRPMFSNNSSFAAGNIQ